MVITFSIGSKCAVMLPRKFLNPQLTPARGLIINRLLDSKALVLIEEVWQFSGLSDAPLSAMVLSSGSLRHNSWGWREVPEIVEEGEYLVVPALPHNIMQPSESILDELIKKSVADFKRINGL